MINHSYELRFPLMHSIRNLLDHCSVGLPAQIPILASQTHTSTLSTFDLVTIQLGTKHGDITTKFSLGLLLDRWQRKVRRRCRGTLRVFIRDRSRKHRQGGVPEFHTASQDDEPKRLEMLDRHKVLQKQRNAPIDIDSLDDVLLIEESDDFAQRESGTDVGRARGDLVGLVICVE